MREVTFRPKHVRATIDEPEKLTVPILRHSVVVAKGTVVPVLLFTRKEVAKIIARECGMNYRAAYVETRKNSFHIYGWYFTKGERFSKNGFIIPWIEP